MGEIELYCFDCNEWISESQLETDLYEEQSAKTCPNCNSDLYTHREIAEDPELLIDFLSQDLTKGDLD